MEFFDLFRFSSRAYADLVVMYNNSTRCIFGFSSSSFSVSLCLVTRLNSVCLRQRNRQLTLPRSNLPSMKHRQTHRQFFDQLKIVNRLTKIDMHIYTVWNSFIHWKCLEFIHKMLLGGEKKATKFHDFVNNNNIKQKLYRFILLYITSFYSLHCKPYKTRATNISK